MVQKRFKFPENSVELYAEKVANRGLCAIAQAESLRYKLLGGLAVRRLIFLPFGLHLQITGSLFCCLLAVVAFWAELECDMAGRATVCCGSSWRTAPRGVR